ncbi:MAG: GNAT family N-acetyltransferase [Oscillospiraceae bacterium]|jgi:GNAT superfamily N-acetyltransferase|nr:GNAT family N-acetyltransferase [Oscillospiraceae bacterium]
MEITFRSAQPGDSPLILSFIRALADYEHMLDEVSATVELLDEWLFEKHMAEVIFAVSCGEEVGFALFFTNFSTFVGTPGLYLEDLYVKPEHRGLGIGLAIMRKLARTAQERGYGRFEWACLDWNEPSIAFYRSLGAEPMGDWTTYRLSVEALHKLAGEKK